MSRLRDCRERAGYSQKQVALILKVKAPSVSNWEKGKTRPTRDNLEKLADLYHVSVDFLMERNNTEKKSVRIPVLGTIPAGIPLQEIEDIRDWEEIPPEWLSGGKEYFLRPRYLPRFYAFTHLVPSIICTHGGASFRAGSRVILGQKCPPVRVGLCHPWSRRITPSYSLGMSA